MWCWVNFIFSGVSEADNSQVSILAPVLGISLLFNLIILLSLILAYTSQQSDDSKLRRQVSSVKKSKSHVHVSKIIWFIFGGPIILVAAFVLWLQIWSMIAAHFLQKSTNHKDSINWHPNWWIIDRSARSGKIILRTAVTWTWWAPCLTSSVSGPTSTPSGASTPAQSRLVISPASWLSAKHYGPNMRRTRSRHSRPSTSWRTGSWRPWWGTCGRRSLASATPGPSVTICWVQRRLTSPCPGQTQHHTSRDMWLYTVFPPWWKLCT